MAQDILKRHVDQNLISYYSFDSSSTYEYHTLLKKTKKAKLNSSEPTKGSFIRANVKFVFNHPNFNYTRDRNYIEIVLDQELSLANIPTSEILPDFVMSNQSSGWLSEEEIMKIVSNSLYHQPIRISKHLRSNYIWHVKSTFFEKKSEDGGYYAESEHIFIDPRTGNIERHRDTEESFAF